MVGRGSSKLPVAVLRGLKIYEALGSADMEGTTDFSAQAWHDVQAASTWLHAEMRRRRITKWSMWKGGRK